MSIIHGVNPQNKDNSMKPEQKVSAIGMLVEGRNQREIAKQVGLSQPTISRLANQDEIKDLVETSQLRLYSEGLEMVVDNALNIIRQAHKLLSDPDVTPERIHAAKTLLDLADKKEDRIGRGAGILPAGKRSEVLINIINQTNSVISPDVIELLAMKGQAVDIGYKPQE